MRASIELSNSSVLLFVCVRTCVRVDEWVGLEFDYLFYIYTNIYLDLLRNFQHRLGPPILCLNVKWSAHEFAFHLLQVLRYQQPINKTEDDDVLQRMIGVIHSVAMLKPNESPGWESGKAMMKHLGEVYYSDGEEERDASMDGVRPMVSLLVYPAWFIFGVVIIYVVLKDSFLSSPMQNHHHHDASKEATYHHGARRSSHHHPYHHRHHHHHRYNHHQNNLHQAKVLAVAAEFVLRLPELDRLWMLWKCWINDILAQMQENQISSSPTAVVTASSASTLSSATKALSSKASPSLENSNLTNNGKEWRDEPFPGASSSSTTRRRKATKKRH